jgi:formylglycine-generating enzyme required for sulfatase activity
MGELFKQDDKAFGKLLKATAIISGDIDHREGGIYITAQLVDSKTGALLSTGSVRYVEEAVGRAKPRDMIGDTALSSERDPDTGLPLEILNATDGAVMVLVPGGLTKGFMIEPDGREKVETEVASFYIDKYEVTNEQYCRFLNDVKSLKNRDAKLYMGIMQEGSKIYSVSGEYRVREGFGKHPVINVTFYGAQAYAQWAGKRLPEILEWQKAAAWDPVKRKFREYPWGNTWEKGRCNHGRGSGEDASDGFAGTAEVAEFDKGVSFYNVFNMAGNVWEWAGTVRRDVKVIDSLGTKVQKVIETGIVLGGSFRKGGDAVTTTTALFLDPEIINFSIGFHCVKDTE